MIGIRVPLGVQVGIVAGLFVASLMALWTTGASVVARERRRADAKGMLERAGGRLASVGQEVIARAGQFPDFPDEPARIEVDHTLAERARKALNGHDDIEGGYLVLRFKDFLGTASSARKKQPAPKKETEDPDRRHTVSGLPPLEADLIDIQVDAAVRKKQVLFSVEELEGKRPITVAIRTSPIIADGRVVGATWVMTRLVDPLFVDRSLQGYRLATGLALGGVALSFALTASLARTVRHQAVERDRLQTDLRRNERLAALGKLLAGVAHEVRNPLAGIRSTAQLWQRGFGIDGESLDGLVHEVDRLEEIVSRLLQFSRADAQDLTPGDLNDVVNEAAKLATGPAESRGIRVEVALDPDLPRAVIAPSALLQVFRNLTANAVHAMAEGGTLRLSTRNDPARRTVEASVSDDGPGIAPEVRDHLFEPFFTTKPEGTGLGLAIAREIALAHQGDLRATTRPDAPGATFTLTLPALSAGRDGAGR